MADSTDDAVYQANWDKRCVVLFQVLVTQRYHRKRQRFFDLADKLTKAGTVLLGASLMGERVREHLPLIASMISGFGLLALVFGYGDRKQAHKELAEQAAFLAAKIAELPISELDDASVRSFEAEKSRLDAKEPPALHTLVAICEWEQCNADGHPGHVKRPWLGRRLIAGFF